MLCQRTRGPNKGVDRNPEVMPRDWPTESRSANATTWAYIIAVLMTAHKTNGDELFNEGCIEERHLARDVPEHAKAVRCHDLSDVMQHLEVSFYRIDLAGRDVHFMLLAAGTVPSEQIETHKISLI